MSQFCVINLNPETHKEEKSLRHVTMVAKFLDLHKPWPCKYGRKKTTNGSLKAILSSIVRQCKWSSLSRKVVWDPEILLPWKCDVTLLLSTGIKDSHKKNGSVLFKFILRISLNYKCISLAFDGQDGNGVQLEKNWANFFKVKLLGCRKMT